MIPNIWENKKYSKPPTSIRSIHDMKPTLGQATGQITSSMAGAMRRFTWIPRSSPKGTSQAMPKRRPRTVKLKWWRMGHGPLMSSDELSLKNSQNMCRTRHITAAGPLSTTSCHKFASLSRAHEKYYHACQ